jgi:hypothetical protein
MMVMASPLFGLKPTKHPPQQQETPPVDLHPEYDQPTMPTRRQPITGQLTLREQQTTSLLS